MGKSRQSRSDNSNQTGNNESPEEAQKFTDEQWENAKTPEQIAELTGWEFTKTPRGSYQFYDNEHDMTLFIDKTMVSNGFVNANSDGSQKLKKGYEKATAQDLRDIVRMCYELPNANKDATPLIIFKNQYKSGTLGQHMMMGSSFSGEVNDGHVVVINSSSFRSNIGHSIRRTLLHESSHALDAMMGESKYYYESEFHGISSKNTFREAVLRDGSVTANAHRYRSYDKEGYFKESWADAASIVQLKQLGYNTEKIGMPGGSTMTVDDWIKKYPNVYKETVKELKTATKNNFKKTDEFNVPNTVLSKKYKVGE